LKRLQNEPLTAYHLPLRTTFILHPLGMPSGVLMRVLADLFERRPASTLHIPRVLFPIDAIVLLHILRLGLLGLCEVHIHSSRGLVLPTQHIHICLTARQDCLAVKQKR